MAQRARSAKVQGFLGPTEEGGCEMKFTHRTCRSREFAQGSRAQKNAPRTFSSYTRPLSAPITLRTCCTLHAFNLHCVHSSIIKLIIINMTWCYLWDDRFLDSYQVRQWPSVSNDRSINSDYQRARLSCSYMNMFIITRTRLGWGQNIQQEAISALQLSWPIYHNRCASEIVWPNTLFNSTRNPAV